MALYSLSFLRLSHFILSQSISSTRPIQRCFIGDLQETKRPPYRDRELESPRQGGQSKIDISLLSLAHDLLQSRNSARCVHFLEKGHQRPKDGGDLCIIYQTYSISHNLSPILFLARICLTLSAYRPQEPSYSETYQTNVQNLSQRQQRLGETYKRQWSRSKDKNTPIGRSLRKR